MVRRSWVSVVGFSFALAFLACPLAAQERKGQGGQRGGFGGGFGGGAGVTRLSLARIEPVQAELKLAQEQKDKISELQASLRDTSGFGGLRDVPQEEREKRIAELREKREKATAEAEKKLADILKPEQTKRLGEIFVQHSGALAFKDATVSKELKLNEEQLGKVNAAIQWGQEEEAKLSPGRGQGGGGGGGRDPAAAAERQEKRDKVQAETTAKALAALTDSQKEQFEKMKGVAFKLDRSAIRGGPGGGRGGQRGAGQKDGEGKGGSDKADAKI